jgi:SAM-dependent methyltransferase
MRISKPISAISNEVKVRSTAASGSLVYETGRAVNEYLFFHFGNMNNKFTSNVVHTLNFPQRCAQICGKLIEINKSIETNSRVLDVGCAVGGTTFQLSKYFNQAVGIDFSQHFIDTANKMKKLRKLNFEILKQGKIFESHEAAISADIDISKISFFQGDACNLDPNLGEIYLSL